MGYSVDFFRRIAKEGVGAIVTKSVGLEGRKGYENPTIVQVNSGIINAMGLPNPGIIHYASEIKKTKNNLSIPLIVSVYGFSVEEYGITAQKAVNSGADAIELNVSCPNVEHTGLEIGQNPEILAQVVKKVKSLVKKPVFVKLSPNVTDITEFATIAVDAGADALTATNTLRAMAIDIESTKPILSNIFGGLSGPSVKPIVLRCVYELYETVNIPIIASGGITNWRDAVEFLLAGASAIQIGSAIALENIRIFNEVNKGIKAYLKKKRFQRVEQIVGLSQKK
jgi:dihydroorotate dehydrogenase (NAD+) catalytic subunit